MCLGKSSRLVQWRILQHTLYMQLEKPIPEIAEVVRRWMPNASDEELKEATINLRAYLAVHYRIFLRREAERGKKAAFDESIADDRVENNNQPHT